MLRILCVIGVLSLLAVSAFADATITNRLVFKENCKQQIHIYNSVQLPDSEMNDFANRALLWTSVVAGGVPSRVRVETVAGQAFYAFPDTVTEVLYQILYSGDVTKSIKALYPQFAEDLQIPTALESGSSDPNAIPVGFSYWDDTLTLQPVPVKADTLYFMAFVEHPSLGSDTMAIRLIPAYSEAAVFYCSFLVLNSIEEYDGAAVYKKMFDDAVVALRERYRPKFDILKNQ